MNQEVLIDRLERFPPALASVAGCVSIEQARWKLAPEHWSILEVCCHVLDEEREDFRPRLKHVLSGAAGPWPPLNLDQVAEKRSYNQRNLAETLDQFQSERRDSISWLRSLKSPDWRLAYQHPKIGPISAGDLLASWAAHDALHLRQIAKRLHGLAEHDAPGFKTRYAGEW